MNPALHLRLSLTLAWEQIDELRRAVGACVQAVFGSAPFRDSLAMVSTELLENAVKYGKSGMVRFSIEERSDGITVTVSNPVDDSAPYASTLVERIAWLGSFGEPRTAYLAALQRAYDEAADSGLGLARIAHEGGCTVSCDTSIPGEVTVSARCRRPDGPRFATLERATA